MELIYIIENKINNKIYVGQSTKTFKERFKDHCKNRKSLISRAINKYGKNNFFITIENDIPEEFLDLIEVTMIYSYNCLKPNGYNLETGGHTNKHLSEETKKKLSKLGMGTQNAKGHKLSNEWKKEQSDRLKGNHNKLGFKCSIETKEIMSKNMIGSQHAAKLVLQFSKDGQFIKEWESATKAGKEMKFNSANISNVIKGIRKSAGGFIWKLKE